MQQCGMDTRSSSWIGQVDSGSMFIRRSYLHTRPINSDDFQRSSTESEFGPSIQPQQVHNMYLPDFILSLKYGYPGNRSGIVAMQQSEKTHSVKAFISAIRILESVSLYDVLTRKLGQH